MNSPWTILYAFIACLGFAILFNVPKRSLLPAALGAAVGWSVYLLASPIGNAIIQSFFGTLAVGVYAEILARLCRQPATLYIIVAVLPMVPGGGIYYTFKHCLAGETQLFIESALNTFGVAGVMALAILLVTSTVRLSVSVKKHHSGGKKNV